MESNLNQQKNIDQLKRERNNKIKRLMMAAMASIAISSGATQESEARGRGNFQAPTRYFSPPPQRFNAPRIQRFAPPQQRYFSPPQRRFVAPPQQRFNVPPPQ
jgi:hypothetical protein